MYVKVWKNKCVIYTYTGAYYGIFQGGRGIRFYTFRCSALHSCCRVDFSGNRVEFSGNRIDFSGKQVDFSGKLVDFSGKRVDISGDRR